MTTVWRFHSVETSRNEVTTLRFANDRDRLIAVPLTHRQVANLTAALALAMERLHYRTELQAAREAAIQAIAGEHSKDVTR